VTTPRFVPGAARLLHLEAETAMLPLKIHQLDKSGALLRPDHVETFRMIRGTAHGPERMAVFQKAFGSAGEAIERALALRGYTARLLGCANGDAAARRLLGFFTGLAIKAETLADFFRSIRGYRSNVAGEILEWTIDANVSLAADIMRWARSATAELHAAAVATRGKTAQQIGRLAQRIVNARNKTVVLASEGRFSSPVVATNAYLVTKDGAKRKFVDALTVSFYHGTNGDYFVAPTTLGQYKFNTAIRKAAKQLEQDPARLAEAVELVFSIGGVEHRFKPEHVLFMASKSRPEMNQYVVTHSDPMVRDLGRRPVYADSPDELLGGLPQISPIVARDGQVRGVIVELALDSRFVLDLVDAVIRAKPPGN